MLRIIHLSPISTLFPYTTLFRSITQLAEGVAKQENFIGIHFFSPAEKMPLVEIIKGKNTNDETLAKVYEDRKSTRLNSSHVAISYAVFCLKKKNHTSIILNILSY